MTLEKDTVLLNRYRIIEILGQGGMGSVYHAIDENLGVAVALKENLFTTNEYTRQFRLEAVILANLRHPNLPRVSDHFELGEQGQYLVMDYIEGEDLRFRMERLGTIPEDDAVQIGAAICDALSYLHSRKPPILHRDIKPGNVKITPAASPSPDAAAVWTALFCRMLPVRSARRIAIDITAAGTEAETVRPANMPR